MTALNERTATELARMLAAGEVSAEELQDAEFSAQQMTDAGLFDEELQAAGFSWPACGDRGALGPGGQRRVFPRRS